MADFFKELEVLLEKKVELRRRVAEAEEAEAARERAEAERQQAEAEEEAKKEVLREV